MRSVSQVAAWCRDPWEAIDVFIAVHNPQTIPFEWPKQEARPVKANYKCAYLTNY
jgi:hypothetical protein